MFGTNIRPDTHCPGIRAGPVDAVGPGCWTVNSGCRLAAMEASWTAVRSERSCSEAAAFCVVRGSSETKPGKFLQMMRSCSKWGGGGNKSQKTLWQCESTWLLFISPASICLFVCFVYAREIIPVWCGMIYPFVTGPRSQSIFIMDYRILHGRKKISETHFITIVKPVRFLVKMSANMSLWHNK